MKKRLMWGLISLIAVFCLICTVSFYYTNRCAVEGCTSMHDHTIEFKSGLHKLCHKHYCVLVFTDVNDPDYTPDWVEDK